jgi:hypothetical protein
MAGRIAATCHDNAVLGVARRHVAGETVKRLETCGLVRALVVTRLHRHLLLVPFLVGHARSQVANSRLEETISSSVQSSYVSGAFTHETPGCT